MSVSALDIQQSATAPMVRPMIRSIQMGESSAFRVTLESQQYPSTSETDRPKVGSSTAAAGGNRGTGGGQSRLEPEEQATVERLKRSWRAMVESAMGRSLGNDGS